MRWKEFIKDSFSHDFVVPASSGRKPLTGERLLAFYIDKGGTAGGETPTRLGDACPDCFAIQHIPPLRYSRFRFKASSQRKLARRSRD